MKKLKIIIMLLSLFILFILFYIFNSTISESVKYSLNICYSSVIPSLFPYFIITEMTITMLAATSINPTVYAFLCSLLSGFPGGTSIVCNLYDSKIITKKQAISLLYCTSNASPAFIISYIGICIIKSKKLGIIILVSQIISGILCTILFKPFKKLNNKPTTVNYSELITKSISNSVTSTLSVCGYITFMGIITDILKYLEIDLFVSKILFFIPSEIVRPVFIGMFEITRGISLITSSNMYSVIATSIIVGFSGISVILQCMRFSSISKLPTYPIIINKIIYAACMPIISVFTSKLLILTHDVHIGNSYKTTFTIFVIFSMFFIYLIFDKFILKLYNKEKT